MSEKKIVLKPEEEWHPTDLILPEGYNPVSQQYDRPQCTCGMEKLGGGLHSDWCDLEAKDEK